MSIQEQAEIRAAEKAEKDRLALEHDVHMMCVLAAPMLAVCESLTTKTIAITCYDMLCAIHDKLNEGFKEEASDEHQN